MRSLICLRWLALVLLLPAAGCASYEYNITRPQDVAGHVGKKADYVFPIDPLEYHFRAVENRLVLRIYNPTDQSLTLLGQRSTVVDPEAVSHPLTTQTMAPHSFIKLILPPMRPRLERAGPSIGIGVGTMIGSRRGRYRWPYDTFDHEPRYFTVYDDETSYWDWNGETTIRLSLMFQRPDSSTFEHEFVIERKKM